MKNDLHTEVAITKKDIEFIKDSLLQLKNEIISHKQESKDRYDHLDKKIENKNEEIYEKIKTWASKFVFSITVTTAIISGIYMYLSESPKERDQKIENNQVNINKQIEEMKMDYLSKYHEVKDLVLTLCNERRK